MDGTSSAIAHGVFRPRQSVSHAWRRYRRLLLLGFCLGLTLPLQGAVITAKGGNSNLSRKQNWTPKTTPGASDIALWDNSSAATTAALGANLSWLGIQILNPAGAITFTAGNTLTLGTSGIDMSAAT